MSATCSMIVMLLYYTFVVGFEVNNFGELIIHFLAYSQFKNHQNEGFRFLDSNWFILKS